LSMSPIQPFDMTPFTITTTAPTDNPTTFHNSQTPLSPISNFSASMLVPLPNNGVERSPMFTMQSPPSLSLTQNLSLGSTQSISMSMSLRGNNNLVLPTTRVPSGWERTKKHGIIMFHHLLVTKMLRGDLLFDAGVCFVSSVFGPTFLSQVQQIDLNTVIKDTKPATPLFLVSRSGDPSPVVESLAGSLNMQITSINMTFSSNDSQSWDQVTNTLAQCQKRGGWLILKGLQQSNPLSLSNLSKMVASSLSSSLSSPTSLSMSLSRLCHPDFRLFFTMELQGNNQLNTAVMMSSSLIGLTGSRVLIVRQNKTTSRALSPLLATSISTLVARQKKNEKSEL